METGWERIWVVSRCTRHGNLRRGAEVTTKRSQTPAKHQRRYRRKMLFQYPKRRDGSRYGILLVAPV